MQILNISYAGIEKIFVYFRYHISTYFNNILFADPSTEKLENWIVNWVKFTGRLGIPPRSGKLKNLDLFDASFFGIGEKQADTSDPQFRIILEVAYEAILDAGNLLWIY